MFGGWLSYLQLLKFRRRTQEMDRRLWVCLRACSFTIASVSCHLGVQRIVVNALKLRLTVHYLIFYSNIHSFIGRIHRNKGFSIMAYINTVSLCVSFYFETESQTWRIGRPDLAHGPPFENLKPQYITITRLSCEWNRVVSALWTFSKRWYFVYISSINYCFRCYAMGIELLWLNHLNNKSWIVWFYLYFLNLQQTQFRKNDSCNLAGFKMTSSSSMCIIIYWLQESNASY